MTNSKAFNIMTLCKLRGIDPDSEEAMNMNDMSVLDLLNAIKAERDAKKEQKEIQPEPEEEEEDYSLSRRAGCQY
jgi:hypothetical protein